MINPTKQAIEAVRTAAVFEEVGESVTLESLANGSELSYTDAVDGQPKQPPFTPDTNAHTLPDGFRISVVGQHGNYQVSIGGCNFFVNDAYFHNQISSLVWSARKYYTKKTPAQAKEQLGKLRSELSAKAKK